VGRSIQPRKREEQPRENTREEKIMSLGSLRRYSKAAILAEMHLARRWQGLLQKIDCLFLALLSCGIPAKVLTFTAALLTLGAELPKIEVQRHYNHGEQ
jgi:hypothetical protein